MARFESATDEPLVAVDGHVATDGAITTTDPDLIAYLRSLPTLREVERKPATKES